MKGGAIPDQFIPAVEKGVRQVLDHGVVAGYPVQDVRVIVYDGKSHAGRLQGSRVRHRRAKARFSTRSRKARPIVLEPIVNVEITAPEREHGRHRRRPLGASAARSAAPTRGGPARLQSRAQAPLSELSNYQARLKSVTAGQGSFSVELSHYDPVPPNVQKDLAALHSKTAQVEEE